MARFCPQGGQQEHGMNYLECICHPISWDLGHHSPCADPQPSSGIAASSDWLCTNMNAGPHLIVTYTCTYQLASMCKTTCSTSPMVNMTLPMIRTTCWNCGRTFMDSSIGRQQLVSLASRRPTDQRIYAEQSWSMPVSLEGHHSHCLHRCLSLSTCMQTRNTR